jgi:hypothetical protein
MLLDLGIWMSLHQAVAKRIQTERKDMIQMQWRQQLSEHGLS